MSTARTSSAKMCTPVYWPTRPRNASRSKHLRGKSVTVKYRVPETSGLCVHLTGQARTDGKHEFPRLKSGHRLSVSWRFYHQQEGEPPSPPPTKRPRLEPTVQTKLIVFSLCDGIGAVPLSANELWPGQVIAHSWEILEHSVKVVKHQLPWVEHHGDFLAATSDVLRKILKRCPDVAILVAAGFPCQDNSKAKGAN